MMSTGPSVKNRRGSALWAVPVAMGALLSVLVLLKLGTLPALLTIASCLAVAGGLGALCWYMFGKSPKAGAGGAAVALIWPILFFGLQAMRGSAPAQPIVPIAPTIAPAQKPAPARLNRPKTVTPDGTTIASPEEVAKRVVQARSSIDELRPQVQESLGRLRSRSGSAARAFAIVPADRVAARSRAAEADELLTKIADDERRLAEVVAEAYSRLRDGGLLGVSADGALSVSKLGESLREAKSLLERSRALAEAAREEAQLLTDGPDWSVAKGVPVSMDQQFSAAARSARAKVTRLAALAERSRP